MKILTYAKNNIASFEKGSVSSNEIHFFQYDGKRYVLKIPLMAGDKLSPFWLMMKNVFHFTFEKQNVRMQEVYSALKKNPHIPVASFVVGDESAMIYEYMEGKSWVGDDFPQGTENAYRLGQYVGYNHQQAHKYCGILGLEDVTNFFPNALSHIETCINAHWNGEELIDKKVRAFFETLKERYFESSKYSLMMVDMCADQFLYKGEDITACVDLDAYVVGPVEWELSFLREQIEDWNSFKAGYETYQSMPAFEEMADFFFFIMGLNSYGNKCEMEEYWSRFLENWREDSD